MLRKMTRAALLVMASLVLGISTMQAEQELAIVVEPNANETQQFAAEELQDYLKKLTGHEVSICTQAPEDAAALLYVGGREGGDNEKVTLGEEGYLLQTTDRGLVLAGGEPKGTLYAVYDFLERLGCRWYYMDPEDEIVPRLTLDKVVQVVQSDLQVRQTPDFSVRIYRFLNYLLGPKDTPIAVAIMNGLPHRIDWLAKNRINIFQYGIDQNSYCGWKGCYSRWPDYRKVFPEMRKRGLIIGVGGHCLPLFLPPEKFEEHPDWFCMIKGKRQPEGQFCTCNEEAVRFYIANLIQFLKDNPEIEYFAPWPNDRPEWCQCPRCNKTPSVDRWMELGRRIYRELKQAVPHVRVTHFAYSSHMVPPEKERPLSGMTVTLCTWGRDMGVPFDDSRTGQRFHDAFASWRDISNQASVPLVFHGKYARQFYLGFHPFPLSILQADCRWFREQGLAGFELPCGFMGRRTKSLNLYVLARLMWDADTDVEAVIDDYFNRCYGQSALPMRKAYELVERAQPDLRYVANYARSLSWGQGNVKYTPEACSYVAKTREKLSEAQRYIQESLDTAENSRVKLRIRRFADSLAYAQAQWQAIKHMSDAARCMADIASAPDIKQWANRLDAAEQAVRAAIKLSDQYEELLAKKPGNGLYWSITGAGPFGGSRAVARMDAWLKAIAAKRKAGFVSMASK